MAKKTRIINQSVAALATGRFSNHILRKVSAQSADSRGVTYAVLSNNQIIRLGTRPVDELRLKRTLNKTARVLIGGAQAK